MDYYLCPFLKENVVNVKECNYMRDKCFVGASG